MSRKPISEYRRLCATAKGRAQLVKRVQAVPGCWPVAESSIRGCDTYLTLRSDDLAVSISFDGMSHADVFLAHWRSCGFHVFPKDFPAMLNTYHYAKATTACDTFEYFLAKLEQCFAHLACPP